MGLRTYRAKNAGAKFTGRVLPADARKDLALIKKIKLGKIEVSVDPKFGVDSKFDVHPELRKQLDVKLGSDVAVLIDELKKTAGTPKGAVLRQEIVRVVSKARKEVACKAKARAKAGGRW